MRVLVAGGTGLVGQPLVEALVARGDAVVVVGRSEAKILETFGDKVGATTLEACTEADMGSFDAVVNLAGENVGASMRWSAGHLKEVCDSRVTISSALAGLVAKAGSGTRLLNASGISVYGYLSETDQGISDEDTAPREDSVDVLTDVVHKWEQAALSSLPEEHPVVLMRIGVVLSKGGGALGKMELPFRMGLGGRIGSGQQGMSWISLRDCVGAIVFLLDHPEVRGPVNLTAGYTDQAVFAQYLASALHRPCLLPAPSFAIRMVLGSAMAQALVLSSYRVEPKRLKDAGYIFEDQDLKRTLEMVYA